MCGNYHGLGLCCQCAFILKGLHSCLLNACFIPTASYTVRFYDGVIQKVKGTHVKPFIKVV